MKILRRLISIVLVIFLFATTAFALPATNVLGVSNTPQMQYLKLVKLSSYLRLYHLDSGFNDDPLLKALQVTFDTDEKFSQNEIRNKLVAYFEKDESNYEKFALTMCQMYDEFSYYMSQEMFLQNFGAPLDYSGFGIVVRPFGNIILVSDVYDSSPADKAGIEVNDRIIKVNGVDLRMLDYFESIDIFAKAIDTSPNITIRKFSDGSEVTVKLTRESVVIPNISYSVLESNIGYLHIRQFAGKDYISLLNEARDFFKKQDIKDVVLDLRDNPGGDVVLLLSTLNMFIPKKDVKLFDIVTRGNNTTYLSDGTGMDFSNVVVLVNESSASSSELCAGVLSDTGYATILGTDTYGKARGQSTLPFFDDSVLHLSMSEAILPIRGKYHGTQITPDIISKKEYETVVNYDNIEMPKEQLNETADISHIEILQDILNVLGYLGDCERAEYDTATFDAVKIIQRSLNMEENGYVSPYLFQEIMKIYGKYSDAYFETDSQLEDAISYINSASN